MTYCCEKPRTQRKRNKIYSIDKLVCGGMVAYNGWVLTFVAASKPKSFPSEQK